jgi:large subunit ribosomal protein L15
MQLHQLKPIHKEKKPKKIGRGGAHGHYCGHGVPKGASRSSNNPKPAIKEFIKKYHKLRGYRFKTISGKPAILNLEILDKNFTVGEKVSPAILLEKKLVRKIDGAVPKVKILGGGDIKNALIFEGVLVSKSAAEKIKKAGGQIQQKQ